MALWSKVEKLDKNKYPTFRRLWTSYPANDPCDRSAVEYQCAVYLSTALIRAGIIGSKGFDKKQGYDPNPTCPGIGSFTGLRLARGSKSLADFLHHRLYAVKPVNGGSNAEQLFMSKKKKGIIFYKNIKNFTNQGGGQGSHIDLWDATEVGDSRFKLGEYFARAEKVYFWEFK